MCFEKEKCMVQKLEVGLELCFSGFSIRPVKWITLCFEPTFSGTQNTFWKYWMRYSWNFVNMQVEFDLYCFWQRSVDYLFIAAFQMVDSSVLLLLCISCPGINIYTTYCIFAGPNVTKLIVGNGGSLCQPCLCMLLVYSHLGGTLFT